MGVYTFEDWLKGVKEPNSPFWELEWHNGIVSFNPAKNKIAEARRQAFFNLVQMHYEWHWPLIENSFPQNLESEEKIFLANQELSRHSKIVEGFGLEKILRGPTDVDLEFIDGELYNRIKKIIHENYSELKDKKEIIFNSKKYNSVKGIITVDDINLKAHLAHKLSKSLKTWIEENSLPPRDQELLNSLQQKLCILYELGILDLLDNRFNNKNCNARGPVTEKAKLLDTILNVGKHERIRSELSKKGFLKSKSANREAIKFLNNRGLTNQKLIDPDEN
ncbi:hypothetical protein [Echinicola sp. 20G]|uniref:hypothetical protein n=1 Tax=Echinicola sp. 20G TaxID=2781961 RepID=UPI0019104CAC|nr:hypothetical protein [Echinicola sp. 20G]